MGRKRMCVTEAAEAAVRTTATQLARARDGWGSTAAAAAAAGGQTDEEGSG